MNTMKNRARYKYGRYFMLLLLAVAALLAGNLPVFAGTCNQEGSTENAGTGASAPGTIKQVKAGVLDVGYAEAGPVTGQPVILLHGWPYDIHSYDQVTTLLAAKGYHVYVPYLRGYGSTRFLSQATPRNGEQVVFAVDILAFMDALKIQKAILGGFDWGARTAAIIAALWPRRTTALVSVSGYLVGSQQANSQPLTPRAEQAWWYQYYFATARGQKGYATYTHDFARLIWQTASPQWRFSEGTFEQAATALDNPDHVAITIDNYRWRIGLSQGEKQYRALEDKLAAAPAITVPAVTLEGDANGAPHPDPAVYAAKFTGPYRHHTLTGGIGHNPPAEAPEAFADAIVEAGSMAQ